jgi:Ca2+-binding RTX toxin-like protein
MSLFTFFTTNPRITGSLDIRLEVLDGLFSKVVNNNIDIAIPFNFSQLPDSLVGNSGNDELNGNSSSFPQSVTIPTFPFTISYPTIEVDFPPPLFLPIPSFGSGSDDIDVTVPPFSITNTPNDFLVGFGGNDLIRGFGDQDVLIGDGLAPNEEGIDGVDTLEGGDGNDVIIGGGAGDNISGGNDDDFILGDYFLGLANGSIPINLDRTVFERTNSPIADLELLGFIPIGSATYSANISAEFGSVSINIGSGNEGNDTISGGNGNDVIISDRGNDLVNGDAGNDISDWGSQ